MPDPRVIIGELLLVIGLCFGCYEWGSHNETLVFEAYKSQQAAKAETQVADNKGALLEDAKQQSAALAKIVENQKGNIDEITKRRDALIADNQHLAVQLRGYLTGAGVKPTGGHDTTTAAGQPEAEEDPAFLERLARLSQFSTNQFGTADVDIADYNALLAIAEDDRLRCDGTLPGIQKRKSADAVPPTSAQPPAM